MYKLLGGLKDYFKLQEIQTDNAVFRLHNVFTTVLLLTCSLVITATQYVGQPISCIVSGIPTHVVNTFCWISSTFTMPDAFRREVRSSYTRIFCVMFLGDVLMHLVLIKTALDAHVCIFYVAFLSQNSHFSTL
jgi:hypothetical protein